MKKEIDVTLLKDIVKNKTVVLVGPSPHLVGSCLGPTIDAYDIVCRVNDVLPKDLGGDYGTRTDILFHGCGTVDLEGFSFKMENNEEITKNIQLVVCPGIKADHGWKNSTADNFHSINKYSLPFQNMTPDTYNKYLTAVGAEPNSGIMSLLMLLESSPKKLFLTGFSFYSQGSSYDLCYYRGHSEQKYRYADFNPVAGHNQNIQNSYFKKQILTQFRDTIKIDSYLKDLLGISYDDVHDLGGQNE
tara:strand:+ start:325 stop:1059 length:735 start_codon:yes stop_codon:yes gene_type:complete